MLDEELDHIIRNAAENHYPPYNDKAWKKMEKKLDKHLPQNKDRRKFIFFLLFFLLLGGATVFTVIQLSGNKTPANKNVIATNTGENKTTTPVTQNNQPGNNDAVVNNAPENENITLPGTTTPGNTNPGKTESVTTASAIPDKTNSEKPVTVTAIPGITTPVKINSNKTTSVKTTPRNSLSPVNAITSIQLQQDVVSTVKEKPGKNKKSNLIGKGQSKISIVTATPAEDFVKNDGWKAKNSPKGPVGKGVKKDTEGKLNITVTAPDQANNENETKRTVTPENNAQSPAGGEVISKNEEKKEKLITVEDVKDEKENDSAVIEKITITPPDKKKPKKNIAGNFGLTFSVGPEFSFIELNKIGKTTLMYGAGLSYNFGKRLTVRSGFYVSKKLYAATPDQYNAVIYPNLMGIDADCKIYEIPLSLSYNFGQRKNHSWFGSAGLSSFLMKTENYDYLYKTPTGYTYNYKRTVKNENKHYFAVLTLSGGYQYQFNKRVSVQAEPYLKIPLSGVGLGKIKLNSAGILFTLTVKPFAKSR